MDATIDGTLTSAAAPVRSPLFPSFVAAIPMIRPERPDDGPVITAILDAAFGPGRHAKVSERVRERATHARNISVVAEMDAGPVGCCRLYDICIGATPAWFLGPLAVHPDAQAGGFGQAMVAAALHAAGTSRPVLVVGQPRFFQRFGFVEVPVGRVVMPGPTEARRLQWLYADESVSGAVSGPRAAS